MTVIFIGICFCAPLFHQNRTICDWYVALWRFQNSGRLPSWILEIYSLCHMTYFGMLFCFMLQKFAEIGRSIAEVCRNNDFEDGNRSPSWILKCSIFDHVTVIGFNICCSVTNFTKIGRYFTEIWRFNDFQNGGRPPSWILKKCSFCHVTILGSLFCFLTQNFAEIGHSIDELWPKKRLWPFKMAAAAILILEMSIFGHVTVIGFNICCSVPNVIKIGRFLSRVSILTRYWYSKSVRLSVRPSVCLSVCLSVTFRYQMKTA